jgi:hypothetical protein
MDDEVRCVTCGKHIINARPDQKYCAVCSPNRRRKNAARTRKAALSLGQLRNSRGPVPRAPNGSGVSPSSYGFIGLAIKDNDMPKVYDQARCKSCEQTFRIADMLKDIYGNHICQLCANPSKSTGVALGVVQVLETCSRCGYRYENFRGSGEGPEQSMPCPKCSKEYCLYCGHAYPGEMILIPGTDFVKCPHCNPGPTKSQNILPRIA